MKKLLTGILSLALAASMSIPALAANKETNDGTTGTDITVNGKFQAGDTSVDVISVDLVWDDMSFTYTAPSKGTWNATEHKYENATEGGWAWDNATETKTAPVITVTNHSNIAVETAFVFNGVVKGLNGNFSKASFVLPTAVGTEFDNAPTAETEFSVDGTAIDADKQIGTITVTVTDTSAVLTAEELRATADQTGVFKLGCNIDLGTSPLVITSSNYTLDLNGFTLSGSIDRESVVFASANSNVTVKNGTVNNICTEYGWAVHGRSATLVLENCELISYSSGLFSENGTAMIKDCNIKTILIGHYNVTNYNGSALTISGNIIFEDGAGLSNQLEANTTALPGTYNFDVSSYVDTALYDVTNDGTTWTVTAK